MEQRVEELLGIEKTFVLSLVVEQGQVLIQLLSIDVREDVPVGHSVDTNRNTREENIV